MLFFFGVSKKPYDVALGFLVGYLTEASLPHPLREQLRGQWKPSKQ